VTEHINLKWKIKFSWEGFAKISRQEVVDFLSRNGYSKLEVERLFKDNAMKISDTRLTDDKEHFVWYKRPFANIEIVETGNVIYIGKHHWVILEAIRFTWYEWLYYKLRDCLDKIMEGYGQWIKGIGKC